MHPNEIVLVFRSELGFILPNREYKFYSAEASKLGRFHIAALGVQIARQSEDLR